MSNFERILLLTLSLVPFTVRAERREHKIYTETPRFFDFKSAEGQQISLMSVPAFEEVAPARALPPGAPTNGPRNFGRIIRVYSKSMRVEINSALINEHTRAHARIEIYSTGYNPGYEAPAILDRNIELPLKCQTVGRNGPNWGNCSAETTEDISSYSESRTAWVSEESSIPKETFKQRLRIWIDDKPIHDSIDGADDFEFDLNFEDLFRDLI